MFLTVDDSGGEAVTRFGSVTMPDGVRFAVASLQEEWQAYAKSPCIVQGEQETFIVRFGTVRTGLGQGKGSFYLKELLGCCGIAVLANVAGNDAAHKDLLIRSGLLAAKLSGYTYVQYTSIPIQHLDDALLKTGFNKQHSFQSKRTGNTITLWLKDLYDGAPEKEKKPTSTPVVVPIASQTAHGWNAVPGGRISW